MASLQVGWDMFLGWAAEVGALSPDDAKALRALVAGHLDRGLTQRSDARHPFTPRINVAGRREYVVHMLPGVLSEDAGPEDPI